MGNQQHVPSTPLPPAPLVYHLTKYIVTFLWVMDRF